jgi:hypothetical protein
MAETLPPDAGPDVLEALAHAGIDGLGLALGPLAKELLPVGVKQVAAVALSFHSQKKKAAFWKGVMTIDETTSDFCDWVNARLAEDPDRITTAFAEGARAAAEKADLAVVPSIGLLVRRYVSGDHPKWFFRGALDLLVSLGAEEFGVLSNLFRQLANATSSDGLLTVTNAKGPAEVWSVGESDTRNPLDFKETPHTQLSRYMRLLKQTGLGHESGAYGIGGSLNAMVIETKTVAWLYGALPKVLG